MTDPVAAMRAFSAAMSAAIDGSVRQLIPADRQETALRWEQDGRGWMTLILTLDNGDRIVGDGPAKLEAVTAARYVQAR